MDVSILEKGFLVDDTLSISVQPLESCQKSPFPGSKRALGLVDLTDAGSPHRKPELPFADNV